MCIFIDINCFGDYLSKDNQKSRDMDPIHKWLSKSGKLVYSDHDKFKGEIMGENLKHLTRLKQEGKAKFADADTVEREIKALDAREKAGENCKSNDKHIIALCLAYNIKVLVTKDQALIDDYKNLVKGNIYKNKSHAHLLTKDTCP